jgi:Rho GTPase-activating protein 1
MYVLSNEGEEEEDLDDDRLQKRASPPASYSPVTSSAVLPPKRHRSTLSSGSNSGIDSATTRYVHTVIGETNESMLTSGSNSYPTYDKAKSMIEDGGVSASGTRTRRGSITIGRGSTRKSSGSSVEAIGVTAEGFLSPQDDAPLVPDGRGGWKKS